MGPVAPTVPPPSQIVPSYQTHPPVVHNGPHAGLETGHTARNNRDTGLTLGWRNQEWWRAEKSKPHGLRHPARFNAMLETEKLLEKTAPQWRKTAQDRSRWKELEPAFVRRFDPPWSSGKQTSLSNLAPN